MTLCAWYRIILEACILQFMQFNKIIIFLLKCNFCVMRFLIFYIFKYLLQLRLRKKHSRLGTLKLRNELQEEITKCGRGFGKNKFFDLLRVNDLLLKRRRRYSITTNSNHPFRKHTNQLVKATITATGSSLGIRYYLPENQRKVCLFIIGY